jgi:hypothetical protein
MFPGDGLYIIQSEGSGGLIPWNAFKPSPIICDTSIETVQEIVSHWYRNAQEVKE